LITDPDNHHFKVLLLSSSLRHANVAPRNFFDLPVFHTNSLEALLARDSCGKKARKTKKMSFEKRKKSHGKPLDKAQRIRYYTTSNGNEADTTKHKQFRFCIIWTLTTEEWKAELELEQLGKTLAE